MKTYLIERLFAEQKHRYSSRSKFRRANLDLLVSCGGDTFLDVVCRDTVSGHDIRRMLALSVIDELVNVEGGRGSWTHYMSNQG